MKHIHPFMIIIIPLLIIIIFPVILEMFCYLLGVWFLSSLFFISHYDLIVCMYASLITSWIKRTKNKLHMYLTDLVFFLQFLLFFQIKKEFVVPCSLVIYSLSWWLLIYFFFYYGDKTPIVLDPLCIYVILIFFLFQWSNISDINF